MRKSFEKYIKENSVLDHKTSKNQGGGKLYKLKYYIIGFIIGLFLITGSTYAGSSGSIGSLFGLKTSSEMNGNNLSKYRLDGANIKDTTVGTEELEEDIGLKSLTVQSINGLFGTGVIFNNDLVLNTLGPTSPLHAVNKNYVDNALTGIKNSLTGILGVLKKLATIVTTTTDTNTRVKALELKIAALEGGGISGGQLLQQGTYFLNGGLNNYCKKRIVDSNGRSMDSNINFTLKCGTGKKCNNNGECVKDSDPFSTMLISNGWKKEGTSWMIEDGPVDIYIERGSAIPGESKYSIGKILIKKGGQEYFLGSWDRGFSRIGELMGFGLCIQSNGYYPTGGSVFEYTYSSTNKKYQWILKYRGNSIGAGRSAGGTCKY